MDKLQAIFLAVIFAAVAHSDSSRVNTFLTDNGFHWFTEKKAKANEIPPATGVGRPFVPDKKSPYKVYDVVAQATDPFTSTRPAQDVIVDDAGNYVTKIEKAPDLSDPLNKEIYTDTYYGITPPTKPAPPKSPATVIQTDDADQVSVTETNWTPREPPTITNPAAGGGLTTSGNDIHEYTKVEEQPFQHTATITNGIEDTSNSDSDASSQELFDSTKAVPALHDNTTNTSDNGEANANDKTSPIHVNAGDIVHGVVSDDQEGIQAGELPENAGIESGPTDSKPPPIHIHLVADESPAVAAKLIGAAPEISEAEKLNDEANGNPIKDESTKVQPRGSKSVSRHHQITIDTDTGEIVHEGTVTIISSEKHPALPASALNDIAKNLHSPPVVLGQDMLEESDVIHTLGAKIHPATIASPEREAGKENQLQHTIGQEHDVETALTPDGQVQVDEKQIGPDFHGRYVKNTKPIFANEIAHNQQTETGYPEEDFSSHSTSDEQRSSEAEYHMSERFGHNEEPPNYVPKNSDTYERNEGDQSQSRENEFHSPSRHSHNDVDHRHEDYAKENGREGETNYEENNGERKHEENTARMDTYDRQDDEQDSKSRHDSIKDQDMTSELIGIGLDGDAHHKDHTTLQVTGDHERNSHHNSDDEEGKSYLEGDDRFAQASKHYEGKSQSIQKEKGEDRQKNDYGEDHPKMHFSDENQRDREHIHERSHKHTGEQEHEREYQQENGQENVRDEGNNDIDQGSEREHQNVHEEDQEQDRNHANVNQNDHEHERENDHEHERENDHEHERESEQEHQSENETDEENEREHKKSRDKSNAMEALDQVRTNPHNRHHQHRHHTAVTEVDGEDREERGEASSLEGPTVDHKSLADLAELDQGLHPEPEAPSDASELVYRSRGQDTSPATSSKSASPIQNPRNYRKAVLKQLKHQTEVIDPPYMPHNDPHGDGMGVGVIDGPDIVLNGPDDKPEHEHTQVEKSSTSDKLMVVNNDKRESTGNTTSYLKASNVSSERKATLIDDKDYETKHRDHNVAAVKRKHSRPEPTLKPEELRTATHRHPSTPTHSTPHTKAHKTTERVATSQIRHKLDTNEFHLSDRILNFLRSKKISDKNRKSNEAQETTARVLVSQVGKPVEDGANNQNSFSTQDSRTLRPLPLQSPISHISSQQQSRRANNDELSTSEQGISKATLDQLASLPRLSDLPKSVLVTTLTSLIRQSHEVVPGSNKGDAYSKAEEENLLHPMLLDETAGQTRSPKKEDLRVNSEFTEEQKLNATKPKTGVITGQLYKSQARPIKFLPTVNMGYPRTSPAITSTETFKHRRTPPWLDTFKSAKPMVATGHSRDGDWIGLSAAPKPKHLPLLNPHPSESDRAVSLDRVTAEQTSRLRSFLKSALSEQNGQKNNYVPRPDKISSLSFWEASSPTKLVQFDTESDEENLDSKTRKSNTLSMPGAARQGILQAFGHPTKPLSVENWMANPTDKVQDIGDEVDNSVLQKAESPDVLASALSAEQEGLDNNAGISTLKKPISILAAKPNNASIIEGIQAKARSRKPKVDFSNRAKHKSPQLPHQLSKLGSLHDRNKQHRVSHHQKYEILDSKDKYLVMRKSFTPHRKVKRQHTTRRVHRSSEVLDGLLDAYNIREEFLREIARNADMAKHRKRVLSLQSVEQRNPRKTRTIKSLPGFGKSHQRQ